MNHSKLFSGLILMAGALVPAVLPAQDTESYEMAPVNYSKSTPKDDISRIEAEIKAGTLKFEGGDRQVVLALMNRLHIPVSSQVLVFSKTSFQNDRISPEHPRSLYYSDTVYMGWVPGGLVELAAIDPQLGPVFYSFDPRGLSASHPPKFARDNDCLRCHGGMFVRNIPGVVVRSVYADGKGEPIYRQGTELVDYRTPFSDRWGGWYVTGTHGNSLHRGNTFASEDGTKLVFNPAPGANLTNLAGFFDAHDYLTTSSDIVSLMVFEHQAAMQNSLTRANLSCRQMLDYQVRLQKDLNEVPSTNGEPTYTSVRSMFDHAAEDVVDTLLFKDEAVLPDKIGGSAEFQHAFASNAPRSSEGNSLKDLLASEHLFKNRCSYLIYSDTFLSLPAALKQRIYARLERALDEDHPDPRYTYIHRSERQRITRILRETHPDFGRLCQGAKKIGG